MKEELEKKLQEAAPTFLKRMYGPIEETCMHWGIETGDGWFELLKKFCTKVEEMNSRLAPAKIVAEQVKSKFGNLTIYFLWENDIGLSTVEEDNAEEEYWKLFREAEAEADRTCEICGATEGVKYARHMMLCPSCKECRTWRVDYDVAADDSKVSKQ